MKKDDGEHTGVAIALPSHSQEQRRKIYKLNDRLVITITVGATLEVATCKQVGPMLLSSRNWQCILNHISTFVICLYQLHVSACWRQKKQYDLKYDGHQ